MKKFVQILMLLFPLAFGFSSCDKEKELEPNPLAKEISGMWYAQYDAEGKNYFGDDFNRVLTCFNFEADGTGYWAKMLYNDNDPEKAGEPFDRYGGKSSDGNFKYSTATDGTITVSLTDEDLPDYYPKKFSLRYEEGVIHADDGSDSYDLLKASDGMAIVLEELCTGGASAVTFNINDADFTPDTWRDQEAIYIWDGTTKITGANLKDPDTYTVVNMPWYQGDKLTNLPDGFCDDITPGNGWEWVLNRCGSTVTPNNNFFAVYNKYSGILRIFYYLPHGFNTGNDHVWQVSMTDHLAQSSVWKYGLPEDKTITDKAALGQTGSGTFMEYVTPWVDYMSQDGLIVPNAGWWAFDVDLSQTRLDDILPTDNIKLQMRSWNTSHVSLASTVAANIEGTYDGKFDLTKTTVSSAKGLTESLSDIKDVGKDLFDAVKSAVSGEWKDAIKNGISFAKGAFNVYGAMNKETTTTVDTLAKGSLTGTITLGMKGNIDTEGTIRGSAPTVGIASPTFYLKDFDTKHTHIGQGVWNLKTPPVVMVSPVIYARSSYVYTRAYFFDPNIQLELNPNVFPEDDIEWIDVNALCFAKESMQFRDEFRTIYGLDSKEPDMPDKTARYINAKFAPWDDSSTCLNDFLYAQEDKLGLQACYRINFSTNVPQEVMGRGGDGFWLEPIVMVQHRTMEVRIPFVEINVTVRVKMRNLKNPIVLSRIYLPEYKVYDPLQFHNNALNMPYASKIQGHSPLYDYQMQRIKEICSTYEYLPYYDKYCNYNCIPIIGSGKMLEDDGGYAALFDGETSTKWYTYDDPYYVEFCSKQPITPSKYYLTTGNDAQKYPKRNPKDWKLMAKARAGDEWSTIATVTNDSRLPAENLKRVEYNLDVTGRQWQYFRLEISNTERPDIQLSEFDFGD